MHWYHNFDWGCWFCQLVDLLLLRIWALSGLCWLSYTLKVVCADQLTLWKGFIMVCSFLVCLNDMPLQLLKMNTTSLFYSAHQIYASFSLFVYSYVLFEKGLLPVFNSCHESSFLFGYHRCQCNKYWTSSNYNFRFYWIE